MVEEGAIERMLMTPQQFQRIEELFHQVRALAPAERRALLDAECRDQPDVRAEVEMVLAISQPESSLTDLCKNVQELFPPADRPSPQTRGGSQTASATMRQDGIRIGDYLVL